MRNLPVTTRLAIATLYLRYRDARFLFAQARADSMSTERTLARHQQDMTIAWNSLESVVRSVSGEIHGTRRKTYSKAFLEMIARRATIRERLRLAA